MATIQVQGLDEITIELLELRAIVYKRSLEDEIVHILQQAALEDFPLDVEVPTWVFIRQDRVRGHKPHMGY